MKRAFRQLDFSLLPSIDRMEIFIRLDDEAESGFRDYPYLHETIDRVRSSLMFFFQTNSSDAMWRNDARLRAGLNEFYSIEDAIIRDIRNAKRSTFSCRISESRNPLVHLMYVLRHIGVHSRPLNTGFAPINVISDLGGERHDYSYSAVMLEPIEASHLLRSREVEKFYSPADLQTMADWLNAEQQTFGVSEVFRRGVSAFCAEFFSCLSR